MRPGYMQSIRRLRHSLRLCALALVFAISPVIIKADEGQVFKVTRLDFSVSLSDGNTYTIAGFLYYSDRKIFPPGDQLPPSISHI